MSVARIIENKLNAEFNPVSLRVIDESHLHAGHAGARPEGETHFRVEMTAQAFAGRSRIERHRLVHDALSAELKGPVHALALSLTAPGE
ncbi:MAG: BolA family transcriptional regulator [Alphaproteobacteria bacterium]|nr:BolA family transcriptional regulator [Alphaproteobacteria bacterium]